MDSKRTLTNANFVLRRSLIFSQFDSHNSIHNIFLINTSIHMSIEVLDNDGWWRTGIQIGPLVGWMVGGRNMVVAEYS